MKTTNLLVYYKATPYHGQLTKMMMTAFNPPLNLENTSSDRQQFRKELIVLVVSLHTSERKVATKAIVFGEKLQNSIEIPGEKL